MYSTSLFASDINVAVSYTTCDIPECTCRNIHSLVVP